MYEIRNVVFIVHRQTQAKNGIRAKVSMLRFIGMTVEWRMFWKFSQKARILIQRKAREDLVMERREITQVCGLQ